MTVPKFRRLSALFGGIAVSLFFGSISIASATTSSAPSSAADKQFARELESLFGATVKTKNGEMRVRQRKDLEGRVRKQIISGPGFSEIQLDQDGDGTVDFLEVTRGVKTVTASQPNRGRFLRLEIAEKTTKGLRESLYLLSLNGRTYNFVHSRLTGNEVVKRVDDAIVEPKFEPTDTPPPLTLAADIVPTASSAETRTAGISTEEDDWMKQQESNLGDGFMCSREQGGIATLQREWWKLLKYDVKNQTDLMIDRLKKSTMFDASCKTPARKKDYDALVKGLAVVMLSSSVGQPLATDKTRGRFLRCLELSGLGPTAARIEETFMKSMNPGIVPAPIKCSWKPGAAGVSNPAETRAGQVDVHICSADITPKAKNSDGGQNNYQNILLHEFMHVVTRDTKLTKTEEENMARSAQACCGDPTDDRASACQKLDVIVGAGARLQSIETHLLRVEDGLTPLRSQLQNSFSTESADSLYKNFLLSLDNYGKPELENGLLSNGEYSKCVAKSSETECRAQWTASIRKHAETFFGKQCTQLVLGSEQKVCKNISGTFKDKLAATIASSMFSACPKATATPGVCEAVGLEKSNVSDRFVANITNLIFGNNVQAAIDPSCGCEIEVPPPPPTTSPPTPSTPLNPVTPVTPVVTVPSNPATPVPPVVTVPPPGEVPPSRVVYNPPPEVRTVTDGTSADAIDERNNRGSDSDIGSGSGGGGGYRGGSGGSGRTRSPLPVTRVDSPSSGRSYAEDRYRRATDLVGGTSRTVSRVRNALLPKAVASEPDRKSGALGPEDKFIVYKPKAPGDIDAKLDNPFSSQRAIASITDLAMPGKSVVVGAATSGSGADSGSNVAATEGTLKNAKDGGPAFAARNGALINNSSSSKSTSMSAIQSSTTGKVGGLANDKSDILSGIFSMPYKVIEQRLKKLEVLEALISRKISVQDADGRVLGSKRPVDTYKFNGLDKPLSKQGER